MLYTEVQSSFSNLSVTSPTSQLILQAFRRFTYVTGHSPNLPLLHLRRSSFFNPSFASPTSLALHLRHLASRPCIQSPASHPTSLKSISISSFHLHIGLPKSLFPSGPPTKILYRYAFLYCSIGARCPAHINRLDL